MPNPTIRRSIRNCAGGLFKLLESISKTALLIIDDYRLTPLEHQQQMDLMELIEDRHGRASTIIASQLPVANWFDIIGEETIADAILDRLVHTSHRIELKGGSRIKFLIREANTNNLSKFEFNKVIHTIKNQPILLYGGGLAHPGIRNWDKVLIFDNGVRDPECMDMWSFLDINDINHYKLDETIITNDNW